ncbi:MAG: GDP-mannose 4,6-dehydratase [Desulfosporosinus sp.]|nr:GDP-mannose 4,6-dehydratase [Desulfosporosinus sp.]
MRVLITGAGGFVGNHLIKELSKRGHEVLAGTLSGDITSKICQRLEFNITESYQVEAILRDLKPEGIIHLAAQSMVKHAWEYPLETVQVNTVGTIVLLNAVKKYLPLTKVVCVGSSEEYGLSAKTGKPLTEEDPCMPQNPYATSKFAAGLIALQMAKRDNLYVIHVRAFNHFGPGQQLGFVVSDFASQIARIEEGLTESVLKVGELSASRDFTDVRDVVRAYALLLENEVKPGIYNICSGVPRAAKEILDFLVKAAKTPIRIQVDETRYRLSDVPVFIGSSAKVHKAVAWQLERNFYVSLTETLDWWRQNI